MAEQKQPKWTKIFSWNRDGKGIYEDEDRTPNLKFFFKLLWRKKGKLLSLNLLQLLPFVTIAAAIILYFSAPTTPFLNSIAFAPLHGVGQIASTPSSAVELGAHLAMSDLPVYLGYRIIPVLLLGLLFVLTFGFQSVGAAYVTRGILRGEPTFVYSDFFYAIRRNLKQGFLFGLLDAGILLLLIFDFLFFYQRNTSFWLSVGFYAILAMLLVYLIMRMYLYLMMITFDLPIRKLIKNAFIFAAVGLKRNVMVALGVVLTLGLHLAVVLASVSVGLGAMIIVPFFYIFALLSYIGTYAAYPVIERYMIKPYETAEDEEDPDTEDGAGTD